MFASMLLSFLLAGVPDVPPQPICDGDHAWADFELTHGELGLVGASPLYDLEVPVASHAARALTAQSVAPTGAAPLFGLEEPPMPASRLDRAEASIR
jgi:hypothetical protein